MVNGEERSPKKFLLAIDPSRVRLEEFILVFMNVTSCPAASQAAILYDFVWRSLRKHTFLKLRGQLELGACARSKQNYSHWHVQRSKNRDDRWRRGRDRAVTVLLGKLHFVKGTSG